MVAAYAPPSARLTHGFAPALPPPRLDRPDATAIRTSILDAWNLTDALFATVARDRWLLERPDPLRNPLVFYLGHPAAFYVNKLRLAGLVEAGVVPSLERLFERGVDPDRPEELAAADDHGAEWPAIAAIWRYRERVRRLVLDTVAGLDWRAPIAQTDPRWAVLMGLEHNRIHIETSSVLLRQLPTEALERPRWWRYAPVNGVADDTVPGAVVTVGGGRVRLGRPSAAATFGWDNEYGALDVHVAPFEARRDLVTNAELLAFTRAGGYRRDAFWSAEGRAWKARVRHQHPHFWTPDPDAPEGFRYRAMFDELPLPLAWPAEVNAYEADAYTRFIGGGWRLPTEAEHARLAEGAPERDEDVFGTDAYNLGLRWGSPTPVGWMAGATSRWGCRDVRGNVWQWLADDFHPLPGFRPHRYYEDFSLPYFDAAHAMMAGGAWASTGGSASRWYRLWFRRHFFQHAGFRLVRSPRW